MPKNLKGIVFCIIIIFIYSYSIFGEDGTEIIGKVLNFKPLPESEDNIATIHRRFLERFFDEVRYDSCYAKKVDDKKYLVAEIFFVGKLNEGSLEGESYLTKKKLREAKDFIIFLWQYNTISGDIKPANFFARSALAFPR